MDLQGCFFSRIATLFLLTCSVFTAKSSAALIAVTGGNAEQADLYEVDPTTGRIRGNKLRSTGLTHITGIAFRPSDGLLFAYQNDRDNDLGNLFTMNLFSGAPEHIGTTSAPLTDIAFGPDGTTLYGWTGLVGISDGSAGANSAHDLVEINYDLAAPSLSLTHVGDSGIVTNRAGIAFDPSGELHIKSGDSLSVGRVHTVNTSTGAVSALTNLQASTAFPSAVTQNSLAIDDNGNAYSIAFLNSGGNRFSFLNTIDLDSTSGQIEFVSNDPIGQFVVSSLAFTSQSTAVPEPSTVGYICLLVSGWYLRNLYRRQKHSRSDSSKHQVSSA